MWCFILFIGFLIVCTNAKSNTTSKPFVFTKKMADACKEHICNSGYSYTTVYKIEDEELKTLKKDSETVFEMHLGIQGVANGHIRLSAVPKPKDTDRVYEFVVGGGLNSFTQLRGHMRTDSKVSVQTPNILSPFEMRGFYITVSQDGLIEFYKEGSTLPLIAYKDVSPLDIKYFSIAGWNGVEVKFLYDCPIPTSSGGEIPASSEELDQQISPSDQLKRDILQHKLPWVSPKYKMDVNLGVKVTSVKYNAFLSKLTTSMSVVISWTDDTMAWSSPKYNGTKRLKFRQGQIWHPQFHVFNSYHQETLEVRSSELISMESSGEATLHFQTRTVTPCVYFEGPSKWPHDEYNCIVVIQAWEVHEIIQIHRLYYEGDVQMKVFSDIDPPIKNEWEVTTTLVVVGMEAWDKYYGSFNKSTHPTDRLVINIDIKRSAKAYNIVFYTPLIVLITFILMSFWTEPLTMNRVWYLTGCSIIICMGLCYIDYLIPCHTLPTILVFYTVVLGGVLLALIVQVLLIATSLEKVCSSNITQRIFAANVFRLIFCLPSYQQEAINGSYLLHEDNESSSIRGDEVEEMEREAKRTFCDKREMAEVIDRIMFLVYSIVFAVMLVDHF